MPTTRRRKKAEPTPPEPTEEAAAGPAAGPAPPPPPRVYACDECERIRVANPRGFVAAECVACGMPVWFRRLADKREYLRAKSTFCEDCRSAPCNCGAGVGGENSV